jgi:multidrug resistance protein, MATE family
MIPDRKELRPIDRRELRSIDQNQLRSIARKELRSMLALAVPLVFAELGWMAMGIVDTMFVGRVSAEAIGAVSIGTTVYYTISIFAGGLLLGLDTLVAQAFGAGNRDDMRRSLASGIALALLLVPIVMLGVWASVPLLAIVGVNSQVLSQALPYMRALNWSTLPLLLFFALRRYLQATNVVKPIMYTLIGANLVNVAGNWIFVFGNLGAPRLGAEGSGWATFVSRIVMVFALALVVLRREHAFQWKPNFCRMRELLALGLPAAAQMGLEFTVWTTCTVLAGRFTANLLAGHQIGITMISTTYMMPLGISSAAAVRVGHALGRGDRDGASRSGWTAVFLGMLVMSCSAIAFLLVPEMIARFFTPNPEIIATAVPILRVAAFFQLFDGFQVVTTGALRGAGDTRTPALCHFTGYWILGFPLGIALAFFKTPLSQPMQTLGLWTGLSFGVIVIGSILLWIWMRTARRLRIAVNQTA